MAAARFSRRSEQQNSHVFPVAKKLESARTAIAKAEAQKARRALASDLDQRDRQFTELQQHLVTSDGPTSRPQIKGHLFDPICRDQEHLRSGNINVK